MVGLCRFVGGLVLALATVAWGAQQFAAAASGAALALVFLVAGQLAQTIADRERAARMAATTDAAEQG